MSTVAIASPEFIVNSTTAGDQTSQSVTVLTDGSYLFSWLGAGPSPGTYDIFTQHYAASASGDTPPKIGGEVVANTTTLNYEAHSSVTALADGGYLVTWDNYKPDVGTSNIYAQRYASITADGSPQKVGSEFIINSETGDYLDPTVTTLSDGGYVVTWFGATGNFDIFAQRYAAATAGGTPEKIGSQFIVNTTGTFHLLPKTTALSDGGYLISWTGTNPADGTANTYAQRFAAAVGSDGAPQAVGSEFIVNTTAAKQQSPSVATLSDGSYVVSWTGADPDDGTADVYAQHYAAAVGSDGAPQKIGGEFIVNTTAANDQFLPSIAALSDGGFVIGWQSVDAADGSIDIYAQRYAAAADVDGTPQKVGAEVLVDAAAGDQFVPTVKGLPDGGYVVSWYGLDPADGTYDIYARTIGEPTELHALTPAIEIVAGTSGDDVIKVQPGGLNSGDQIDGLAGTDTLALTSPGTLDLTHAFVTSIERLQGTSGDDVLIGSATGPDGLVLDGRAGADILIGDADGNSMASGNGDVLLGGADADHLYGDVRGTLSALDGAIVHGGDDRLDGGGGGDVLYGDASGDMAAAPGASDAEGTTVHGGADILTGGTGDDTLVGDAGGTFDAGLSSTVRGGDDDLSGDTGNDLLVGDALGDMIGRDTDALAQGGNDTLHGGDGRDTLTGDTGGSLVSLAESAAVGGNDRLDGGDGADILYGDARADLFADSTDGFVRAGDDSLSGGDGNDTLYGDAGGNARVVEATMYTGNDTLDGGNGNDVLYGDVGGDIVVRLGTSVLHRGDDTLSGGDGNDVLVGDAGGDIRGEDNSSFVVGGNDVLDGGTGNDVLYGDARGSISVDPGAWFGGNDILNGGDGNDVLYGDAGGTANVGGSDILDGGAGRDVLWGGKGADVLMGGSGSDRFMFAAGDGGATAERADVIADFERGSDQIGLTGGLHYADLSLTTSGAGTTIAIAATGEILATVMGVTGLTSHDFIIA